MSCHHVTSLPCERAVRHDALVTPQDNSIATLADGILLVSATRLLIISNYSTTTATTVASSTGYVNTLLGTAIPLVPVFLPYIAVALLIYRRWILSAMAFGATILISPTPFTLHVAYVVMNIKVHQLNFYVTHHLVLSVAIAVFLLVVVPIGSDVVLREDPIRILGSVISILTALALIPYLYEAYPVPHTGSYYAAIAREPWLPTEQIALSSGRSYYGYVLSTDNGWFTVLLASSRTIQYVAADNVHAQIVCQLKQSFQPAQYGPLVPLLHTGRTRLTYCSSGASVKAGKAVSRIPYIHPLGFLSRGQSLDVIASAVHVIPEWIISETNAYQKQRLSAALRTYEEIGNWNAPTPMGQHFWYFPPVKSGSILAWPTEGG